METQGEGTWQSLECPPCKQSEPAAVGARHWRRSSGGQRPGVKEALDPWMAPTPSRSERPSGDIDRNTWEEPHGTSEEQWAFLSGRSAGFSAKSDLELGCSCQSLGLETDGGENSALLRNRPQKTVRA